MLSTADTVVDIITVSTVLFSTTMTTANIAFENSALHSHNSLFIFFE